MALGFSDLVPVMPNWEPVVENEQNVCPSVDDASVINERLTLLCGSDLSTELTSLCSLEQAIPCVELAYMFWTRWDILERVSHA